MLIIRDRGGGLGRPAPGVSVAGSPAAYGDWNCDRADLPRTKLAGFGKRAVSFRHAPYKMLFSVSSRVWGSSAPSAISVMFQTLLSV